MPNLFIGPYKSGLERDVEPWLLPEDAFPTIEDAYVWRGRVRKKPGVKFIGRLQRAGATAVPHALANVATGDATYAAAGWTAAGDRPISPGSVTIRIAVPVAGWGNLDFVDNGNGTLSVDAALIANLNYAFGIIDYETGDFDLFWDPILPAGGPFAVTVEAFQTPPRTSAMGIQIFDQAAINRESVVLFDEDYSYEYNNATLQFQDTSFYKRTAPANAVQWTGDDANFFWMRNYRDVLWATNNIAGMHGVAITGITVAAAAVMTVGAGHTFTVDDVVFINEVTGTMSQINGLTGTVTAFAATTITVDISTAGLAYTAGGVAFSLTGSIAGGGDGIRYYDGLGAGLGWRNFCPALTSAAVPEYLWGALALISYKGRLIAFNTDERPFLGGGKRHYQRARWSQNGTPFYNIRNTYIANVPNPGYSWTAGGNDIGRGGYIDAPTNESIVSVALIKDALIVFFERSTWQLQYTGSELLPFVWARINEQLGAESTFSPVGFGTGVLAVGDKSIVTTNSISVQPIDEKIPDEVFNFHNDNDGPVRIHGIRDFYTKMVYWTFPNDDENGTFPNRILALNYEEKTFSIYHNSLTCFGTMQFQEDYTWAMMTKSWEKTDRTWGSPANQSYIPDIVAGNQKGIIVDFSKGLTENEMTMDLETATSITAAVPAVCQVTNHNLKSGQFVRLSNVRGFVINVVDEDLGTALTGSTGFLGTLAHQGVIPGILVITIGGNVFTDLGNGTLYGDAAGTNTINYATGVFTVNFAILAADTAVTATYNYNEVNARNFRVVVLTADTFSLATVQATGADVNLDLTGLGNYQGSGQVAVIDNFNVVTKRFAPFIKEDSSFRLSYFESLIQTAEGDFTVNLFGDQNSTLALNSLVGSSTDDKGKDSEKNWTRFYGNMDVGFLQLQFTMSPYQLSQRANSSSDFQLHALNLKVEQTGRML